MVNVSGNKLSIDYLTTSRLMNESDAPESSSAKWVVFFKTMGRNSNGIGAVGPVPRHQLR